LSSIKSDILFSSCLFFLIIAEIKSVQGLIKDDFKIKNCEYVLFYAIIAFQSNQYDHHELNLIE
jgi:hypothetical protein